MKNFYIVTIFPEAFTSYFNTSLIKKAQEKKIIKINLVNLRDFTTDKHKTVDDRPYGGGPGMVLKIEPIYKAILEIKKKIKNKKKTRIILFSYGGEKLNQEKVKKLKNYDNFILICGRYEGVDERVAKYLVDEEISIGDYILSGGELAAMVFVEVVSRYFKGFLNKKESLEDIKGSYPVYTKPRVFKKWVVPEELLTGDHKKIKKWREENKKF